jgi:hypothetical protein
VVSIRIIIRREEEANITTTRGQEKKRDSKGEVYKKQETFEPYIYFS